MHVCDLSQYVANMFDGASLLIRTHMRYCRQAGEGRGGGELTQTRGHVHADDQQKGRNAGKLATQEEELTVTALLISSSRRGSCD